MTTDLIPRRPHASSTDGTAGAGIKMTARSTGSGTSLTDVYSGLENSVPSLEPTRCTEPGYLPPRRFLATPKPSFDSSPVAPISAMPSGRKNAFIADASVTSTDARRDGPTPGHHQDRDEGHRSPSERSAAARKRCGVFRALDSGDPATAKRTAQATLLGHDSIRLLLRPRTMATRSTRRTRSCLL